MALQALDSAGILLGDIMKDKIKQQLETFYSDIKALEYTYSAECKMAEVRYKASRQELNDKCIIYKMALEASDHLNVAPDVVLEVK